MKILLVSNMYPSKKYPHYGVFVKNTQQTLSQLPGAKVGTAVLCKHTSKPAKLWGYLKFYAQTICKGLFGGYDVIYAHFLSHVAMPLLPVMALNKKVTLVLNAHGNDVIADTPHDHKWIELSRKIAPKASYIIVPSAYFKQLMVEDFQIPEDRLLVYPSGGINTAVFHPQNRSLCVARYGLDEKKHYVGYISRIEADKGWDTFLKTVAALKNREELEFLVVGDGAELPQWTAMAEELGISHRIIHYPLLSQQEIAELFSLLDVFCFPTRRKSESLGLVGLEAMACGTTVVASNAGGPSSYMVADKNGFVFPATDAQACISQVERALAMTPQEHREMQEEMAKTVNAYSTDAVNSTLLSFFQSLKGKV